MCYLLSSLRRLLVLRLFFLQKFTSMRSLSPALDISRAQMMLELSLGLEET